MIIVFYLQFLKKPPETEKGPRLLSNSILIPFKSLLALNFSAGLLVIELKVILPKFSKEASTSTTNGILYQNQTY